MDDLLVGRKVGLLVVLLSSPLVFAEQEPIQTGYYIDAPVTGLYYETSSNLSGFTTKGAYNFRRGDVVSFYLGVDENSFLLSRLSSQEVVTPTLSTTKPSRSINMTRLLLSLDSTPENRREILLLSDLLSNPKVQQQLQRLDLNNLTDEQLEPLNVELVSTQEAVEHLNQSQQYITKHFASDEIVFEPVNQKVKNIIIKLRDYNGKICAYDLRLRNHPEYHPPIGGLTYRVTKNELIEYPDIGDRFNGCLIQPNQNAKDIQYTPLSEMPGYYGVMRCAQNGCTRNEVNGFIIDDYNDEGDWKYRSLSINFDPTTQLLMEKMQGLGRTKNIHHSNQVEEIWFTYPAEFHNQFAYEGIWKQTTYHEGYLAEICLLIEGGSIKKSELENLQCPNARSAYQEDVTPQYGDMWWVSSQSTSSSLEQMNMSVRWYPTPGVSQITTWEYLPTGKDWHQGILYRYQQNLSLDSDGMEKLSTHTISEYEKIHGVII